MNFYTKGRGGVHLVSKQVTIFTNTDIKAQGTKGDPADSGTYGVTPLLIIDTAEGVECVETWLNNYPREILGFLSAAEAFEAAFDRAVWALKKSFYLFRTKYLTFAIL